MLLCSNKVCLSYLAKHEIVNELQTLLECAKELEDVTANLIYKIITGEGEIKTTLVTTESGMNLEELATIAKLLAWGDFHVLNIW